MQRLFQFRARLTLYRYFVILRTLSEVKKGFPASVLCQVTRALNTKKKLIKIKYSSPTSKLLDISKQIDLKFLRSRYNNLTISLRSRQFPFHFQEGRLSEQPSPATYLFALPRSFFPFACFFFFFFFPSRAFENERLPHAAYFTGYLLTS